MIIVTFILARLCLRPYSHITRLLLSPMILFVVFLLLPITTLLFIPTLRLKISPTYSEGHQESDEGYTTEDAEGYRLALGFYMRPK